MVYWFRPVCLSVCPPYFTGIFLFSDIVDFYITRNRVSKLMKNSELNIKNVLKYVFTIMIYNIFKELYFHSVNKRGGGVRIRFNKVQCTMHT